jgi:hypothetical protein
MLELIAVLVIAFLGWLLGRASGYVIGFRGGCPLLAMFIPIRGAVLLLIAGIAFIFIAGWWALLGSPFLLVGAVLA